MKSPHKSHIQILTGMLVGTLLSAGAIQGSELLALSGAGYNPNTVRTSGMASPRHWQDSYNAYYEQSAREKEQAKGPRGRIGKMMQRQEVRKAARRAELHSAAPRIAGEVLLDYSPCIGLSGIRHAKCMGQYLKDGTLYDVQPRGVCKLGTYSSFVDMVCKPFKKWEQ